MSPLSRPIHLRMLSRVPQAAQNVAPDVKLTFLVDVFEAAIPLFENKNPQNPEPDGDDGDDTGTT